MKEKPKNNKNMKIYSIDNGKNTIIYLCSLEGMKEEDADWTIDIWSTINNDLRNVGSGCGEVCPELLEHLIQFKTEDSSSSIGWTNVYTYNKPVTGKEIVLGICILDFGKVLGASRRLEISNEAILFDVITRLNESLLNHLPKHDERGKMSIRLRMADFYYDQISK